MKQHTSLAERFAAATDALQHGPLPVADTDPIAPELALAVRLRAGAAAGIPDPDFVRSLRADLRARITAPKPGTAPIRYSVVETPIGRLAIAYRDGRVVYCSAVSSNEQRVTSNEELQAPASPGAEADSTGAEVASRRLPIPDSRPPTEIAFTRDVARALGARPEREDALPATIARGVRDHFAGKRRFTAVDLSWLPPFQQKVLQTTAQIPRGQVRPYGWVAREMGAPGATRAVGTALGHNPIPYLIPCHRVVRADGTLGEYSGGGPAAKERVLVAEGAPVTALREAAGRGERYRGSRTTHVVCYPTCHHAQRIRPEHAVGFGSLARATAGGFRPCLDCRPA